jgi:hypothetical protein
MTRSPALAAELALPIQSWRLRCISSAAIQQNGIEEIASRQHEVASRRRRGMTATVG